jgi:hypothetical protein
MENPLTDLPSDLTEVPAFELHKYRCKVLVPWTTGTGSVIHMCEDGHAASGRLKKEKRRIDSTSGVSELVEGTTQA